MEEFYTDENIKRFSHMFACIEEKWRELPLYTTDIIKPIFYYTLFNRKTHTVANAIGSGKLNVLKFLFSKWNGSPPGLCKRVFSWPFMRASMQKAIDAGHLDLVRYLFEFGFEIEPNFNLSKVARNGHLDIIRYLVSLGVNIHNELSSQAVISGNLELVKYLISNGADVRANNNNPLRIASKIGRLDIVQYLVLFGADICDIGYDAKDALENAVEGGHLNVVKYLVENSTIVNHKALASACKYGSLEIVKYLVESGFNIHYSDDLALKYASLHGYFDIIKYLVSRGANINAGGQRAYRNSKCIGRIDICCFLSFVEKTRK